MNYRNVMRKIDAAILRRRHFAEVNDPAWRKTLRPVRQHPRRERRRPGKPR